MYRIIKAVCLGGFFLFAGACSNGNSGEFGVEEGEGNDLAGKNFYSQKKISYGDSLHIRVLSWGGKETGSYLVLLADSVNRHFIGDSFFRQGTLANAWVEDLDQDGYPEVGVVLKEPYDLKYGRLILHELSQDFTLQARTLPPLPEPLGAAYGGGDSIYVRADKVIVREFNILDRLDTLSHGNKRRRIYYVFENNQLQMSDNEEIILPEEQK